MLQLAALTVWCPKSLILLVWDNSLAQWHTLEGASGHLCLQIFRTALDSGEYVHIRNSLIILNKIVKVQTSYVLLSTINASHRRGSSTRSVPCTGCGLRRTIWMTRMSWPGDGRRRPPPQPRRRSRLPSRRANQVLHTLYGGMHCMHACLHACIHVCMHVSMQLRTAGSRWLLIVFS
jgi:hypothetical protein